MRENVDVPAPLSGHAASLGLAGVGAVLVSACAPAEAPPAPSRSQAIYLGRAAPDDHAVFFLSSGCTAALIAPRTLLTAAHCVDDAPRWASNALESTQGTQWTIARTQSFSGIPADWSPDLALALLDQAPPVTPLRWRATGPMPQVGTMVRHVGYGVTETGTAGERRTVELPISGAGAPQTFGVSLISGQGGAGICFGDSGGPALVRDAQGEAVLAVHSYTYGCGGPSGSALVYPYRRVIEQWLARYEGPSCARDTRCVAGCTPDDLDCTCGPDGVCGSTCVDGDDPDCPPSCRPDGVCSTLAECPVDLDCLPLGTRCLRESQCATRLCLSNPQNPTRYCSQTCSAQAPCPADYQCEASRGVCVKAQRVLVSEGAPCAPGDACADGTRCATDGLPPSRCLRTCASNLECAGSRRCDFGLGVCVQARPITLDAGASWAGPLANVGGCSASGGALGLLGLGWGLRRRR